jgi:cytochrome c biogenesis protein CcmG/thiol:disulfide interchange protein DsbE
MYYGLGMETRKLLGLLALVACGSPQPAKPAEPVPLARPIVMSPAPVPSHKPQWIGVLFEPGTARIAQVIPGSPADKAGLQRDDEIVSFDNHPITLGKEVPPLVQLVAENGTVGCKTKRGEYKIHVEARPSMEELAKSLVGKPAPAISLPLYGGGTFDLGKQRGHIVVLDFWATWCGPCVAEIPTLESLQQRMPDIRVVGVATEEDAALKEEPTKYPVAHDEKTTTWRDYFITAMPTTFVIDERGIVRHVELGLGDPNAVEKVVASLRSRPSP